MALTFVGGFLNPCEDYSSAMKKMEVIAEGVRNSPKTGIVWFLRHKPVFTTGTMGLKDCSDVPIVHSSRGGLTTYHDEGQAIVYLMLNTQNWQGDFDVNSYVSLLEGIIIEFLQQFNIGAFTINNKRGVWIKTNDHIKKIAAIGIRASKFVTTHGFAINVCTNLNMFGKIVPCGIKEYDVASINKIIEQPSWEKINETLRRIIANHIPRAWLEK